MLLNLSRLKPRRGCLFIAAEPNEHSNPVRGFLRCWYGTLVENKRLCPSRQPLAGLGGFITGPCYKQATPPGFDHRRWAYRRLAVTDGFKNRTPLRGVPVDSVRIQS